MPIYSSHGIAFEDGKIVANMEHKEYGHLLLGGRFNPEEAALLEKSVDTPNEVITAAEVLARELEEELYTSTCRIDRYMGWTTDRIKTLDGQIHDVDRMYFFRISLGLPYEEPLSHASGELRLMTVDEIQKEMVSPAMAKIVRMNFI